MELFQFFEPTLCEIVEYEQDAARKGAFPPRGNVSDNRFGKFCVPFVRTLAISEGPIASTNSFVCRPVVASLCAVFAINR